MSVTDGYVVGTSKIVDHGPDFDRWNLVILGDGYRDCELMKYHTDVQNFLTTFRTTPPFDELFRGINVYRIDVVSAESGADDPIDCECGTGATPRTYFDATFCSSGIDRLLSVDDDLAVSVASAQVPRCWRNILVFVNSCKFGGSGDPDRMIATCSTHDLSPRIAIHELGHSAFKLDDEYDGDNVVLGEPVACNVTLDTNRATNKWRDLIADTTPMPTQCNPNCKESTCVSLPILLPVATVGTYEGAKGKSCNIYRPYPACYMRNLRDYSPSFCPVCERVIRQTLQPCLPPESIT